MSGASNWVHLGVVEIIRETDATFLIELEDELCWVPKSQISEAEQYVVGDKDITMSVTEWLAKQKGWSSDE